MKKITNSILPICFLCMAAVCSAVENKTEIPSPQNAEEKYDFSKVPGVVVAHIPSRDKVYTCSPSLLLMPDGSYLASHCRVSNGKNFFTPYLASVFKSEDKGKTWRHISDAQMNTAELFYHKGALYFIGTRWRAGDLIIRKSTDGGITWSEAEDSKSGLLQAATKDGNNNKVWWSTTPSPVLKHGGKLWFVTQSRLMYADEDSDLLDANSWKYTDNAVLPQTMRSTAIDAIMEYNAVYDVNAKKMCIVGRLNGIVDDIGVRIYFDEAGKPDDVENWFTRFPGAGKKFTVRYDEKTKKYYSLTNWVPEEYRFKRYPKRNIHNVNSLARNTLALIESSNLRDWVIQSVILQGDDINHDAFQYVHFDFEGDDIVMLSRTAWFDGVRKPPNMHDSNFITFHRIKNFRERNLKSPLLNDVK